MKRTAFLYLLLFAFRGLAQNYSFSGVVKDADLDMPVAGLLVTVDRSGSHSHTDASGRFGFSNLGEGVHYFMFEKTGYETKVIQVDVTRTLSLSVLVQSKVLSLQEIAIKANRSVSAASSSYLSQINFNNRPRNSGQDLLRLVPGLFIAQHAGGGKAEQIFIRGFDCDHGTDVATFVDGIPVNMPSHGHGQGYADLHFLIPELVEGISIFKGTSSPLYGDFATGAAVGFKTYDSLPYNLVQMEGGGVAGVKAVTSKRLLALLKVPVNNNKINAYFAIDGINNRGYFNKGQDFNRINIFGKTTFNINQHSKLQFSVSGFGSSWNASGQIPERAVSEGRIDRFGSIDPNEGGTTQRNNYNLTYTNKTSLGEFETQAYMFTYRFRLFSNFTFYLEDSINGDMIEQGDSRTVRGFNAKYTMPHKLGRLDNKFIMGASFRADDIENQLWHAPARIRMNVKAHANIFERSNSIFANEVFRFTKRFRAELGLRYDYVTFDVEDLLPTDSAHANYSGYNYQSAVNPKLNLIYTVTDRTQFFFNAGSGFHSNDARAVVQDKNNHKLPLAVSAELGTLLHPFSRLTISAALWAMDLDNELVYMGDDGTTENKGASRRYGIDFSLRTQVLDWLFADLDVNYAKGRLLNTIFGTPRSIDYYIPLAPSVTSAGGLTARVQSRMEIGLRYRYLQSRAANEDNSTAAKGYTVLDFSATYKLRKIKLGLVIENLLNTAWNEAQFDTESRLQGEVNAVKELHYTPETPFYARLTVAYIF